jgi:carboxymethylenebutenolidase
MFTKLDPEKRIQDFLAGAEFLKKLPENSGRTAVVGFCFGGGISNIIAARVSGLSAAVTFYGAVLKPEDAKRVSAPLLLHYAALDERINAGWPAFEQALKENNVTYEMHMYPNVNHAFHNDATPRYDEAAAKLAWSRTIAWLKKYSGV